MKPRVLSAMRPTGRLHIGHLEGVLRTWADLQRDNDCYFFVADWHALTTNPDTREIQQMSYEMVKDWLAMGINPDKSTLFIQSQVPQHAELHVALSMLNTVGRLYRVPSWKDQAEERRKQVEERSQSRDRTAGETHDDADPANTLSFGFLGYPVLQAADILMYRTTLVPVGEDQLPHIELTREIARKFNTTYGEVFSVPEARLSNTPRILGTDGRKMSKSYGNEILPTDDGATLAHKIRTMRIDPNRQRITDPGNPLECTVYDLHHIYNVEHELDVQKACRSAQIGCKECKMQVPPLIHTTYADYRHNRERFSDKNVEEILREGTRKARVEADKTMRDVRRVMLMEYWDRGSI